MMFRDWKGGNGDGNWKKCGERVCVCLREREGCDIFVPPRSTYTNLLLR